SLASGASGLAGTFFFFLVTRCFVGVGGGAFCSAAPPIMSGLFSLPSPGGVVSRFFPSIPLGGALGFLFGGVIADSPWGWRSAFYVVVPPGLLLALWCFVMPEAPRGHARRATLKDYPVLLRTPSFVLNTLGMTAMTFAVGGIAFWMPKYIYKYGGV